MKILVTGSSGLIGSEVVSYFAEKGHAVYGVDNNMRADFFGPGGDTSWRQKELSAKYPRFKHSPLDIRDRAAVLKAMEEIKPKAIIHTAAQPSHDLAASRPFDDFDVNAVGTLNLLEAVRAHCPAAAVIYSSTNKTYGDLEWAKYSETATRYVAADYPDGFPETIPLEFHSPYGCSKGAADQYMLDYHRIFGLKTAVFRHSSMYGGRQFSTFDQGWIGWFVQKAIDAKRGNKEPFTISGNGKQVRDVLYADDMVSLYLAAAEKIDAVKGQAFNIGGGMANSLSLLELFAMLEEELGVKLNYTRLAPRESDQKVFVADISKAGALLGWKPLVDKRAGVKRMIAWVADGK